MTLGGSEIAIGASLTTRRSSVHHPLAWLAGALLAVAALAARAEPPAEPASAQPASAAPAPVEPAATAPVTGPEPRNGPSDRAELEAFIDGLMAIQLKDKHIAGATVSVVVDGKPFFAKGYGYADVARQKAGRSPRKRCFASARCRNCSLGPP